MNPTRVGFEIETKRETSPKDSVRILNNFSLLTDTIEEGIRQAFDGKDGITLKLAGQTGMLKNVEEQKEMNMKTIMMSVKPKWVQKIMSGEKTVEIRSTRPMKEKAPFRVFVYCTKEKPLSGMSGKIVGEFVCDDIIEMQNFSSNGCSLISERKRDVLIKQACLSTEEFINYAGDKNRIYGWVIGRFTPYRKPVDVIGRPPQSWFFYNEKRMKKGGAE